MKLKKKHSIYLMVAAALITIIGLLTGWYFFLLVWLPLGFSFGPKSGETTDKDQKM